MEIKLAGKYYYQLHQKELFRLYEDAFSKIPAFQLVDEKSLLKYFDSIFNHGFAIFALKQRRLRGALLSMPLLYDEHVPVRIRKQYSLTRCFYIAELMVDELFRNQGIGRNLLFKFLEEVNLNHFSHAFIRVWDENKGAMALCRKIGFTEVASIVQPKMKANGSGVQDFKKLYLVKELKR
jgi:ribosomal protein S18 acetylase RimI-like enzyme